MPDMTGILDALETIWTRRNYAITEKRCKHRFSIIPTMMKKLEGEKFEEYGFSWLSKIVIFQEKYENGVRWFTVAVLKKDDALLYLLER